MSILRLGGEWLESSPEDKDLWGSVGEILNMSWQCVLADQNATVAWVASRVAQSAGRGR